MSLRKRFWNWFDRVKCRNLRGTERIILDQVMAQQGPSTWSRDHSRFTTTITVPVEEGQTGEERQIEVTLRKYTGLNPIPGGSPGDTPPSIPTLFDHLEMAISTGQKEFHVTSQGLKELHDKLKATIA